MILTASGNRPEGIAPPPRIIRRQIGTLNWLVWDTRIKLVLKNKRGFETVSLDECIGICIADAVTENWPLSLYFEVQLT